MTGETPEVRSDKRKPREKKREKKRKKENTKREREREKERKREKRREKERKRREKDVQGQSLSICIQFAKRKTKYIGRNAQNFKKWPCVADL